MITRALAVLALVAGALLAAGPPAHAATTVVVEGNQFTPGTVRIPIDGTVVWSFQDPQQHTTTSNQDFWDSGPQAAGSTYSHRLPSAGTYRYHCALHAGMTGSVRTRMTRDGSPAQGWTVRWSTAPAPAGRDFDVQFRRQGASSWTWLRRDTETARGRFDPARDGTYVLRARTSNTSAGASSGWSPLLTLEIT